VAQQKEKGHSNPTVEEFNKSRTWGKPRAMIATSDECCLPAVEAKIGSKKYGTFIVDSGASHNMVSLEFLSKNSIPCDIIKSTHQEAKGAGSGHSLTIAGKTSLAITFRSSDSTFTTLLEFIVIENLSVPLLLSWNFICNYVTQLLPQKHEMYINGLQRPVTLRPSTIKRSTLLINLKDPTIWTTKGINVIPPGITKLISIIPSRDVENEQLFTTQIEVQSPTSHQFSHSYSTENTSSPELDNLYVWERTVIRDDANSFWVPVTNSGYEALLIPTDTILTTSVDDASE